jgi:hypothetical protein
VPFCNILMLAMLVIDIVLSTSLGYFISNVFFFGNQLSFENSSECAYKVCCVLLNNYAVFK